MLLSDESEVEEWGIAEAVSAKTCAPEPLSDVNMVIAK